MARHLRIEYPALCIIFTALGNDRRPIFENVEDRKHPLELPASAFGRERQPTVASPRN